MKKRILAALSAMIVSFIVLFTQNYAVAAQSGDSQSGTSSTTQQSESSSNQLANTIIDNENVFNDKQKEGLSKKILSLYDNYHIVAGVITNSTFNGLDGYDYAKTKGDELGLGDKGTNNGLLIAISMNEHKTGIAFGEGVSKMSDQISQSIIDNNMIPYLKENNPYGAAYAALSEIEKVYAPAATSNSQNNFTSSETSSETKGLYSLIIPAVFVLIGFIITLICYDFFSSYLNDPSKIKSLLQENRHELDIASDKEHRMNVIKQIKPFSENAQSLYNDYIQMVEQEYPLIKISQNDSVNNAIESLRRNNPDSYYSSKLLMDNSWISDYKNAPNKKARIQVLNNFFKNQYDFSNSSVPEKANILVFKLTEFLSDDISIHEASDRYEEAKKSFERIPKYEIDKMALMDDDERRNYMDSKGYSQYNPSTDSLFAPIWYYHIFSMLNNRHSEIEIEKAYEARRIAQQQESSSSSSFSSFNSSSFGGGSFGGGGGASGSW